MATWTNKDFEEAVKAAKAGEADAYQERKLREAAKQAGSRGQSAKKALGE